MQSEPIEPGPPQPTAQPDAGGAAQVGSTALIGADGSPATGAAKPIAPPWLAGGLAAAGLALLVFTLVRAMKRRAAQRRQEGEPAERIASIRTGADQRDQLTNLMVDVEELTRRFAAQLDNKAAHLEMLLAEADETIRRLESAGNGRAGAGGGGAGTAAGGGSRDRGSGAPPTYAVDDADPVTRDVYRLADEGCSSMEIARRLEQHTGKVELILALRNV